MAIGAAIIGGLASASAAKSAAKSRTKAANNQLALQREMYDQTRTDLSPYRDAGANALAAVNYELGLGAAPDGYSGFQASPGYQFAVQQGQDAIERSAANSGGFFSGQTGKSLTDYRIGMANQDYGNYFNRLYGLANMGQASSAMQAQANQNLASQGSNALANIGNAQAAGAVGVGNAINNGIGNALGIWQYQNQTAQPNTSGIGWGNWGIG